jgi:hypothetical protein
MGERRIHQAPAGQGQAFDYALSDRTVFVAD